MVPPTTNNRYTIVTIGCLLFLFTPGMLWYFGNGYVHTAIILPAIIGILMLLIPTLQSPLKITPWRLLSLALLLILLVYTDWMAVFIVFCTATWILFRHARDRRYLLLALVLIIATLAGIALILWQFASYTGLQTVFHYWQLRFLSRSITNNDIPF
ncbi:hypothetical protein [Paraflavitalea speifideaquila]|uniref:hypothetical protein n=1 Tax=Paraflavitalea speifideaquila TaxID=3076558 RepID=UPI0028EA50CE|nr:hypothetical protein [Paraflavitalea speifideiaquila]